MSIPRKAHGLQIAKELKKRLLQKGYPIRSVFLFGSLAQDKAHKWSDIDIAVVCSPFLGSKFDEKRLFSAEGMAIDTRTEVVCLRPEDFENKYFTLAQEVQRHGIPVEETRES